MWSRSRYPRSLLYTAGLSVTYDWSVLVLGNERGGGGEKGEDQEKIELSGLTEWRGQKRKACE